MIGGIDSPIYTNFARHLYRVRIKGTSLQNVYPTIELAYAAGFLGKEKPYNDVWIKIAVEGYDEKFLFKINTSDKDWFKDLNERVASRLGKPHVTVVFQGEALNEYTLYKIVHSNHSNVYSVEYRQANIPVFKPTSASSSSSTVLQRLSISQTDFASIIQGFLENALTDLSKQVSSGQSFSIEEWIEGFSAMSKEEVFDFIFNYYKTYQLQINGTPYRLMDIIAQQQPPVNVSHVANTFVGISRAFTSIILDNLNAKRSLQHDKKAAASLLRSSIKMFAAQYTARLVDLLSFPSSSSSTGQREPLDDDDNDQEERDEGEEEDVAQPIATELRFIGVKFNVPLPSLSGTANRLRNAKNSLVNATSKSKYVEFSLSPAASMEVGRGVKGRVLQLLQNVVSEVEPGDMLRYRILPGDEPKWVRVDIEENAADYRGNFSKDGWTIVTSNKIRRPSSVAFDAPYMTFPLVWARYRVRVYVERKDAVDRWKLEGERNFNCSVKGGKKGNEFTWAQLREVVANEELSAKLKVTKEIQSMRVSNRPPFVFRDIQGGPTISHFPKDAYKCLETAWRLDEEQQQDDSLALVFWSELKSYAQKKSQRILVARKLIWARFNNARLDASRYETESLYNPAYEDEYIHAPVVPKGECPYDDDEHQEESISAWYNPLPPLTDANMGFGTAGSNTRTMVVDKRYQELNLPMAKKAELASVSPAAQERQRRDLEFLVTKVVRPSVIVPTFSRSSSGGRTSPSILTSSPPPSPINDESENESEDEADDLVLSPPPAAPLQALKESYLKNRRLSTNDIRVKRYEESITTEDEYREIADSTEANVIVTVSIPVFLFTSAINLYTFKQVGSYSVEQRFIAGELKTEPGSEIPNLYGALFNDLTGQLNPYKVYFLVYDTRPGQIQSRWVNATQELYQSISSKDSEVSAMILCEQTVFRENFNARRRLASILNVYGGQVKLDPNARFSPVSFVKFWVGRTPYPSANDSLASMTDAYVNLANLAVFTGLNTEKRIDDDGGIHLEIAYTTTIVHVDANGNTFITNVPVDSNSKDASLFDAFVIDENNYSIWFNHSTISIDLSKVGDAGSPTTTNAIIDKGLGVFIVTLKNVQPPKDIAEKLRFYNYAARTLRDVVSKRYHNNPSNGWNVSPVEHKRLHTLLGAFIVVKPQDSGKGKGKAAASSGEEDELIPVTGRDQSSTEKLYALKKTFFVNRPLGYNDIVVWSERKYITNDEELANAKEKLRTFVNIPVFRVKSTTTAYRLTQKETLIFESGSLKVNLVKSNTQNTIGTYDFASFTTSFGGLSIRALYSNQGRVTMRLLDSDTFNSISEKNSDVFGIIISPPNRYEPKDHMFNNLIGNALNIYAEHVAANPQQKVQPPNLKYVIFAVAGVQYLSEADTSDEMLIAYMTFSNSKAFVNVEAELIPTSDPILLNVNYIARRIWINPTGEVAIANVNVLSFNYEQSLADLLLLKGTQSVRIPYIDTNNEIAFANNVKTTGDVVTRGFSVFVVTENDVTLSQEIQEKLKTYLEFINRTQDAIKGRIANGLRKWMSAPDERNTENQLIDDFTTKDAEPPAASSSSPSASSSAGTSSPTSLGSRVKNLVNSARSLLPVFSSSPPTPPTPVSLQPSSSSGAASSSSTSDTGRRSSKSSSSRGATSSSPPEQYYTYLPSSFTVGRGDGRVVTIPEFALDDTKNYGVKYTRDVKVGNTQISTSSNGSKPYVYTAGSPQFNRFFRAKNGVHAVTITEDGVKFKELTSAMKLVGGVSTLWSTRNIVALFVSNNKDFNLAEDKRVPPSLDAFKNAFAELKGATNEGRQVVFDTVKNHQFFTNTFNVNEHTSYLILGGSDPIDDIINALHGEIAQMLPRSLIRIANSDAIATANQNPVDYGIPVVFDITVSVLVYFDKDTVRRSTVELRSNGLVIGGEVDYSDVDLSTFAGTVLGDAKFNDHNVVFMHIDDNPVTNIRDAVMKGTYAVIIHPPSDDYAPIVDDLRSTYMEQLKNVSFKNDDVWLAVYKRVFEDDIAVYDKNKIIGAEIIGDEHLPGCLEEWIGHYAKRGDILEEDGAHLILLPSDTRQLNEDIVAGRIDAEDHIEKYTHRFPFGDSFAKHARKLPPIEVNGQKLIVRRNFNKEAGRLELAIETENGHIHSVPVTTYVDEASRLVVSVPSSAFFKF